MAVMRYERIQFPDAKPAFVVTFDVCSSSELIEKLTLRHAVARYIGLLGRVKHFLADSQKAIRLEPYKFTGDGWILLVAPETQGDALLKFMRDLSAFFRREVRDLIDYLDHPPATTGINFGVDRGPIFHAKVFGAHEYVARPIIIACRLQAAIKMVDEADPAYKALVSREVFAHFGAAAADFQVSDERVELRNVGGGAFHCKKITLLHPPLSKLLNPKR
jgi:hypothetical protein